MERPRVFITDNIPVEIEKYISEYCDCEIWKSEDKIPREELFRRLGDVNGIIVDGIRIDEELLNHAPRLKVVCNISVGYNNFDIDAMKKRRVMGTNTPGVLNDSVADLVIGLMLSAARRIPEMDRYVKNGSWQLKDYKNTFGVDLHHSTAGIIGMGRIGEAVAKRLRFGFDTEVIYYNRTRKIEAEEKLGVVFSELDTLLGKSDFIVVLTPLTKETYHLIDHRELSLMKDTAIFINASRGQTVNEKALIEALKNSRILGAGLDVFTKEPVESDNELLRMPNVVTLPHLGTATYKTTCDMTMMAARNLVKALLEGAPPNIVPELK